MQPILRAIPLAALALAACSSGKSGQPQQKPEPQHTAISSAATPPMAGPAPSETERAQLREKAASMLIAVASVPTTETTDPARNSLRANAIEGLLPLPGRLEPVLRTAFTDRSIGIRSIAAMAMGKARIRGLVDAVQPLTQDDSPLVQGAAAFALARNGAPADLNVLANMLVSPSAQERALAAFILGELGNKSAIPMLVAASKAPGVVGAGGVPDKLMRLQIAEALVKLGKTDAIEEVRAALFPAQPEEAEAAALAIMIIGQVRDKDSSAQLNNIIADAFVTDGKNGRAVPMPLEVRLAAAASLARFNDERAPLFALGYATDQTPGIRAQAAAILGEARDPHYLPNLALLMSDADEQVRISAASAIIKVTDAR